MGTYQQSNTLSNSTIADPLWCTIQRQYVFVLSPLRKCITITCLPVPVSAKTNLVVASSVSLLTTDRINLCTKWYRKCHKPEPLDMLWWSISGMVIWRIMLQSTDRQQHSHTAENKTPKPPSQISLLINLERLPWITVCQDLVIPENAKHSRSSPYECIKFGYPLENAQFLLLSTNLAREYCR